MYGWIPELVLIRFARKCPNYPNFERKYALVPQSSQVFLSTPQIYFLIILAFPEISCIVSATHCIPAH